VVLSQVLPCSGKSFLTSFDLHSIEWRNRRPLYHLLMTVEGTTSLKVHAQCYPRNGARVFGVNCIHALGCWLGNS